MKIAHISDFHARQHLPGHPQILKRRSRRMPELIARAIADIRSHEPDVLVVSGDLVDVPFYGMNDDTVRERTQQDLTLIRQTIDEVGCPVFYLFGNHDHSGAFEAVFPDADPDVTIGGYRFVSFFDHEVTDHFAERREDERARFDRVLHDDDQTPQVHLQHYMVWPEHNKGYPHSYREAAALKTLKTESGKVVLSLSGHYHVGQDATLEDGVWFATSRAFCEPPHPYRIYDLQGRDVHQTEYELGAEQVRRALFVDVGAFDESGQSLVSALIQASESGWAVVGVSRLGGTERQAFEIGNDRLCERLAHAGLELEALACSFKDEINSGPYFETESTLGVDLGASKALVTKPEELNAAEVAGLETADVASNDLVAKVEGWSQDA